MSIQAGLVGLPNVGKSTLFNALTKSNVPAENYPFCTIDPHVAITHVPDPRMDKLQHAFKSGKQIPATVTFVDIAGLVKGAASGEGLGNQFLSHIQGVDLILHVLRCFEQAEIQHHRGTVDPLEDYQIIVAELMLKDLESAERRLEKLPKLIKTTTQAAAKKELEQELELLEKVRVALNAGDAHTIRTLVAMAPIKTIPLLSAKNSLIIANMGEHEVASYENNPHYQTLAREFGAERVIPISAKIESELAQLPAQEAQELMGMFGLTEPGLTKIIRKSYEHLGLITFFTCGPREIHAWPIRQGTLVRQASGVIHSDLERGFICAEVYNCEDLFKEGSEVRLKELGKIRREGQDYIVHDGDVILVRFNV